ncbi:MAG: MFS transporter [Acidobacteria bacterium]|nr:MFS transporter [Acidobacteriota bacterium]
MGAHESDQAGLSSRGEPSARRASSSTTGLVSWAFYDWASSAFATVIQTFVFAAYFTRHVAENETVGSVQWGNTLSAAAIVVAIGGPILGAMADQGGRRKPWIGTFTALCVGATALLWFVRPSLEYVWLALFLVWLGTIGEEFAAIFYNAMLPSLVGPERLGRWSGWAWGLGYAGGLASLVVALFAFVRAEHPWFSLDRTAAEHVRATFLLVAAWYLLFAMPLFLCTPDGRGTGKGLARAARDGLRQLSDSIRQVRRYKDIIRFLIARMIYIDGLATVFAFGGVYAAGTFKMTEEEVLIFGIALNVTAGLGAASFAWLDDWIGGKRTILVSLVGLIVPAALILLVQSPTLFWVFGLLLGVFVGPVQAASRSFLARVAPAPLLTEMFGLYALSGKATAFLGPLFVGWLTYLSGSQRIGMSTVIVFFILGFLLMLSVPSDRKIEGALRPPQ